MSEVHVEKGPVGEAGAAAGARSSTTVEIEREITKREVISAVTSVVLVVLYMVYSFVRDRDPGVVALDAAADDWE